MRITRPFEIGRYEVTQSEWEMVMGSNPSRFSECGGRCPVEDVNWEDLQRYIAILNSAAAGVWTYRLPTEAEWEYAARAGERGERWIRDLDAVAWYSEAWDSEARTHPVGLKRPNRLGLYDMIRQRGRNRAGLVRPLPRRHRRGSYRPAFPAPTQRDLASREGGTRLQHYGPRQCLRVPNFFPRDLYHIDWDDPRLSGRSFQGFRLVRTADAAVNR